LVNLISTILNAKIEAHWITLPKSSRLTLQLSLATFNRVAELMQMGEPISTHQLNASCLPLVEAVLNSEHIHILGGVLNHDNYTYAHSVRVATLLILLGYNLGLNHDSLMALAIGGLMHDIGKTSIPYEILNKQGPLTEEDTNLIQSHVVNGVRYLEQHSDVSKGVITIVSSHHERLDGSGYPGKLKAHELNDLARMAAIVDVYVALTERRPYRAAIEPQMAVHTMIWEMRDLLDMKLLRMFQEVILETPKFVSD
jgi:putative nucleotidyltransferase with HDIG domain